MTDKPTTSTFNFNALIEGVQCSHSVRAVTLEGSPWFVAQDACRVLGAHMRMKDGYEELHTGQLKKLIGADQFTLYRAEGDSRQHLLISEKGLYKLIGRSDKPHAKPFQDWLFGEVVPSIRKTGGYQLGAGETMPLPTSFTDALRQHASGTRAPGERWPPNVSRKGRHGGKSRRLFYRSSLGFFRQNQAIPVAGAAHPLPRQLTLRHI
ncbi:BRO family protein [Bosea sp. AS-1]|uniref:BRO-N domain-containing protein n=1 Tax=Bosea sp. AS-1 TaxID=2015316 RepID=UPI000B79A688|nr:BRO family protein [Bosea sp. AS-1]